MTDTAHTKPCSPRSELTPGGAGRIHPCTAEEFHNLDELVHATEDGPPNATVTSATPMVAIHQPNVNVDAMSSSEAVEALSGLLYVVFTVAVSLYYLSMLTPAMSNDLWWAGFNVSGAQSYLIDVFNAQLNLETNMTMDLHDAVYGIAKDYSTFYTPIEITPVYTRQVQHAESQNFASVIESLTRINSPETLTTQFCWLDFGRKWEVAHTDKRQRRCNTKYTDNAAMYWEPGLRTVNWIWWMTSNKARFDLAFGNALRKTADGRLWLNQTANAYKDVPTEVAYWQQRGMTRFVLQYNNLNQFGMDETLNVRNAVGSTQAISMKRLAPESRTGMWTTAIMNWGPWNDFIISNANQVSLIRSDSASMRFLKPCNYSLYLADSVGYSCPDACGPSWPQICMPNFETAFGLPPSSSVIVSQFFLGPFGSVDLFFVPPAPTLQALYVEFYQSVTTLMQTSDKFFNAMMAVPSLAIDPVPRTWQDPRLLFFGGDPTCPQRQGMPFVQSSFAFDAACNKQEPLAVLAHKMNVLFGLVASNAMRSTFNATAVCAVCPAQARACSSVVTAALNALNEYDQANGGPDARLRRFNSSIAAARVNVTAMGVSIVQFAHDMWSRNAMLLSQPMLQSASTSWDLFGWMYLFEWMQSSREVVKFEGDKGAWTLLSDKYAPIVNEAQALEVPKSSCKYLWTLSAVVSSILVIVGGVVSIYSVVLRGRIVGRNLFQFNRIVGAVWLGRPFLLVRGLTAVILLSTAQLSFESHNSYSRLHNAPRNIFETMVVSGEAMWISYVINDFLLLLTRGSSPDFAPMSTTLGWIVYVVLDTVAPYEVSVAVQRKCNVEFLTKTIACTSGDVNIGNYRRAFVLVVVQIASVVVSFVAMTLWKCCASRGRTTTQPSNGHLLLSGTATAFLRKDTDESGAWQIDRASCVMCGLLTFGRYIFDLKLWLVVVDTERRVTKWRMKWFQPPELNAGETSSATSKRNISLQHPDKTASGKASSSSHPGRVNRIFAVLGLGYMCATIFGSITYLSLTTTNMSNDFWWANYNSSREHVFVAKLFNNQLLLRPQVGSVLLNDPKFMDTADYNVSSASAVKVTMRPLYTSQIMATDATNIQVAIAGLRNMDACLAMWISTQYCYVDFAKTWTMANTQARQQRCDQRYSANGAVYLEAVLRNVQWPQLQTCWGTSLAIGFEAHLNQSDAGRQWWSNVQNTQTTVDAEGTHWRSYGVTQFASSWQNYKSIGIIETFRIQNAFGFAYPMTLKHTNGSMHVASQTSMKMYWGFASDLWAIASPTTPMYMASLVRNSSAFAFRSQTMESVLLANGTLQRTKLVRGAYAAFRTLLGPFGSVDLKLVAAPASLSAYFAAVNDFIAVQRKLSKDLSLHFARLQFDDQVSYAPPSWLSEDVGFTIGGNLMCNENAGMSIAKGTYMATSGSSSCNSGMGEFLYPSPPATVAATLGANLVRTNLTMPELVAVCETATSLPFEACSGRFLGPTILFLRNTTYFPDRTRLEELADMADIARKDVRAINIEIFQYVTTDLALRNVGMLRHSLFDANAPSFDFVSWMLAHEWAMALREVISFEGDVGSIYALSSPSFDVGSLVNPLEIPVNVVNYIRYACLYVTCIIICVSILATMYLCANKGYIEGLNLFEVNRVAGIVWIGRTILFIRGLAAISLLSTQVLTLEPINYMWHFNIPTNIPNESTTDMAVRLFTTFLAAAEVSWLSFVLNDVLVVFTQQYTTAYVFKCNFLVWGVSAMLSLAYPATHAATIARTCEMAQVDFQLVCNSGTIEIGSVTRFFTLIAACVACIVVCYLYERLRHPHLDNTTKDSLFLSSSAKYVFDPSKWVDKEVYYIDPASAVINGILSFRVATSFYIFDLKIWRLFVIEGSATRRQRFKDDGDYHLVSAIPLAE